MSVLALATIVTPAINVKLRRLARHVAARVATQRLTSTVVMAAAEASLILSTLAFHHRVVEMGEVVVVGMTFVVTQSSSATTRAKNVPAPGPPR